MSETAVLSRKFRITIPKAVREQQQWVAGQKFVFIPEGNGVLMMPVPELGHLLAGVTAENRHDEQSFGAPQVRELL